MDENAFQSPQEAGIKPTPRTKKVRAFRLFVLLLVPFLLFRAGTHASSKPENLALIVAIVVLVLASSYLGRR